ncbi:MAG: hypothetical protein N2645_10555 [Clostridia bacterium]|nr:hypothetical protein [Clostridia bacterium]
MKIASSSINMSGKSSLIESYSKEESLKMWVGNQRPDFEGKNSPISGSNLKKADTLELSEEGKTLQTEGQLSAKEVDGSKDIEAELSEKDKRKIELLQKFIEWITGKKIKFVVPKDFKISADAAMIRNAPPRQGWGLEYDAKESVHEKESMSFSAEGIVKTSDGKEIRFTSQLNMDREFASQTQIRVRAGDAMIDPLVIHFNGKAAELTNTKFSFDIDSNGSADQISFASPNSGFLALDLNNDGTINNGSELFGPNTGDGFSELSKYDSDHNNWIDENDPIYDKLRIFTKDENGKDMLFALGEKGIGAIYLGNVETNFHIKDPSNETQGQIRKSGIFLKEDGTPGVIQHIDLAV